MFNIGLIFVFVIVGIISGVVYNIFGIVSNLCKKNIIVNIATDFFATLLTGLIFIMCIFKYSFGEFNLFQIVCFILGFEFEQIFIEKVFAKPFNFVYNKIYKTKN